jgi:predicted dehydrogenase
MERVKVGMIGCGNISGIYLKNLTGVFRDAELVAVADLVPEKAEAAAREHGLRAVSVDSLLADPAIRIVLNLTTPLVHAEVNDRVLSSGKSVYVEKPLGVTREQGAKTLALAHEKGLRVGCAPDTFLGGGIQTCRKLIDDGWIGTPIAATAFMTCRGHESWHPAPEFYYKRGGGPMFDMGPYYLTALVNLMGPVRRVTGSNRITFPQRLITSQPKQGTVMAVEVPTHVASVLDFQNGAVATTIMSFDVWAAELPRIEIYGTEGSLSVPDPNGFGGPVRLMRKGGSWTEMPLSHGFVADSRGIGLNDMAAAIRDGRPHRASGDLAFHVLDVMQAVHESSDRGCHVEISSPCARPAAMPM